MSAAETREREIGSKSARRRLRLSELEPALYWVVAGACTLWVACRFYSALKLQTTYSRLWARPELFEAIARAKMPELWSAPLDDVFIHFDFARSTAQGHPFEWSAGAGYSSGGTSLLYPFVLAFGYRLGFSGLLLMLWAALVACVAVFATLLAVQKLCVGLPRFTAYLLPPGLLCLGALDWSLFSGMEVAFFLGVWSAAFLAWDALWRGLEVRSESLVRRALMLGWAGMPLVLTRPEGLVVLCVLAASGAWAARARGLLDASKLLALALGPSAAVLLLQALANRWFTGEFTAAGALAKLEIYHPFMSAREIWDAWLFHLKYQVLRVTQYHFADNPITGWIVWLLACVPLCSRRTRRQALMLWSSALGWVMVVALNGQVRWQNERYSMPAVAWLLLAATLGLGLLLSQPLRVERRKLGAVLAAAGVLLAGIFVWREMPRFREQLWFFGRASRNIRDQQLSAGAIIRNQIEPTPRRVLVGDAGAIAYASGLPGLDIIGLGGFRGLPFARAARLDLGAAIELIERIPAAERPDLMAIYPSWWKDLPLWFGTRISEVPVRGNVICGGPSKVLYQAHWEALDAGAAPFSLAIGERVVDALDLADLVSEREHGYELSAPRVGHVTMKLLPSPSRVTQGLWDAGRIVPAGVSERFRLRHVSGAHGVRLIVRAAPLDTSAFDVSVDGVHAGRITLTPADAWSEVELALPTPQSDSIEVRFEPSANERTLFQIWAVVR